MQLVNGAQFLNHTFLLVLFTSAPVAAVMVSATIPLTRIMHRYNHIR